ncbi:MAG: GAF domain-containing protein [Nitrospirae bacterium]|nr:GAF domain-containing protein [Nitrospirota bacterium]
MLKQRINSKFNIDSRFLAGFLLVALVPLALLVYFSYRNAGNIVKKEVINNLISIANRESIHINSYIAGKIRGVTVLAQSPDLINAMEEIDSVYMKQGINSPEYHAVEKRFRPYFTFFQEKIGYFDLFLICPSGEVIFSVKRESDIATNLMTGPYKDTDLAKVVANAASLSKTEISDFEYYLPSGEPVAFIAAPVMKEGKSIGVVAMQLSIEEFRGIVNEYASFGRTGEIVLAARKGNEAVFITPVRHDLHAAFNRKVAIGSGEEWPVQEAVQGREGAGFSVDYRGEEVLAVWRYLPELRWGMVVKIDTKESFASVAGLRNWAMFVGIAAAFCILLIAIFVSRFISMPIRAMQKQSDETIRQSYELLDSINTIQSGFISEIKPEALFNRILDSLLALTRSEYGFVGEVLYSEDGAPYLKAYAITNIAWDNATKDFYKENISAGMEFRNLDTLFGAALTSGEPVISNDPPNDPRSGGLPEGHPPLNAFLAIPFGNNGKLLGMVGVANCEGGYDESLLDYLKPFISTCKNIMGAYKNEVKRRDAEGLIFESKLQWEETFNNITDMVTIHDRNYNIIRANKAAEKILGLPFLQSEKAKCFKFYHGADSPPEGCPSCNCLKSAESVSFEIFEPHLGKFIEVRAMPRFNGSNELVGLIHIVRDITEKKQAEEKLKKSESRLSEAQQIAKLGSWKLDLTENKLEWSDEVFRIFGFTPNEFGTTYEAFLNSVHPEDRDFVNRSYNDSVANRTRYDIFHRVLRPDGEVRIVHEKCEHTFDDAGRIICSTGIVHDVTEQKLSEKKIEAHLKQVEALRTIDMAITSSLDLRVTLSILLEQVVTLLNVDAADILLRNPHEQVLEYASGRGFRTQALRQTRLRIGEGNAGRAAMEKRIITIRNMGEAGQDFIQSPLLADEGFVTYYAVPLIAKGYVEGVIEIFHRALLEPDQNWLDFLDTLGRQAAIAIDNSTLFHELQHSRDELIVAYDRTIEGWAKALDHRDKETEGHSRRVTDMTVKIAKEMGIINAELVHVYRGALLHDIGKLGVPDGILLKPGKLNDEEWAVMKRHTVIAYEILSPIPYLQAALFIPYCHHEKWDGTGYPRGLRAEEIPLPARIFAVVDVWDALTSDRPYRPAWPDDKALEFISSESGRHFDPEVVETFFKMKLSLTAL